MEGGMLPAGALEALARRAFAFPFLTAGNADIDLTRLDPSDDHDRRLLLDFEHPDHDAEHIETHLRLARRLWNGDPPQLWTIAEYLLDKGPDRHDILHRLMAILDEVGDAPRALRSALRGLRDEVCPRSAPVAGTYGWLRTRRRRSPRFDQNHGRELGRARSPSYGCHRGLKGDSYGRQSLPSARRRKVLVHRADAGAVGSPASARQSARRPAHPRAGAHRPAAGHDRLPAGDRHPRPDPGRRDHRAHRGRTARTAGAERRRRDGRRRASRRVRAGLAAAG